MYPLMFRRTYAFTDDNRHDLQVENVPMSPLGNLYAHSFRFSFIATPFRVSPPDSQLTTSALAYINNVDPSLTDLYVAIEDALASSVPLFERVLTDLHRTNPLRQRIPGSCRYTEWDEPDPPDDSEDEEGWFLYEREMRSWSLQRPLELPDIPKVGYRGGLETRRHVVSLRGRDIEVIVKVTEIHLVGFIDLSSPTRFFCILIPDFFRCQSARIYRGTKVHPGMSRAC